MVRGAGRFDVQITAFTLLSVPTPPTATQSSADVQLSPVISTIEADASFTGMLTEGVHVPSSSAKAKAPVPVESSPATLQLPHDVQFTASRNASVLLAGAALTFLMTQLPPVSVKSAGVVLFEVDSSPTATQPLVVQLNPYIVVPEAVETGAALLHVPPDSVATPARSFAPLAIGPTAVQVVPTQLIDQIPWTGV
jgi:hypothetical protein